MMDVEAHQRASDYIISAPATSQWRGEELMRIWCAQVRAVQANGRATLNTDVCCRCNRFTACIGTLNRFVSGYLAEYSSSHATIFDRRQTKQFVITLRQLMALRQRLITFARRIKARLRNNLLFRQLLPLNWQSYFNIMPCRRSIEGWSDARVFSSSYRLIYAR